MYVSIGELLSGRYEGKEVAVRGWVYRKRESKNTIFLVIRDSTGIIQCTVKADSEAWKEAEKLTIESSLSLEGCVKQDKR
ncbi:MAG: OB-fold nucleic acid binding domain-containing protein, partial [Candidatus Bathyarchaeia archaeon]